MAFSQHIFNQALASENAPYSGAFTQTKEIYRKSKTQGENALQNRTRKSTFTAGKKGFMTSIPAPFPFPGGRQDQGQLPGASGPRTQARVSLPHQALQPGVNLIKKTFLIFIIKVGINEAECLSREY
jgi:hypothetical protein